MDTYGDDDQNFAPEQDTAAPAQPVEAGAPDDSKSLPMSEADKALLKRVCGTIKGDKSHHRHAFKLMREDMNIARTGRDKDWSEKNYTANITGQFIQQKTGALYAKNPRIVAERRETMDFAVWDETDTSLKLAFQTVQTGMQQGQLATQGQQQTLDPTTGMQTTPTTPELPQGFEQAQSLIADFQQGMQRRTQVKKLGQTLEILFRHAMDEQKPLDFKMAMKKLVRRTCTTSVGYVELGFQREYGPRPGMEEALADCRQRMEHISVLKRDIAAGDIDPCDAEVAELQASLASLQSEPEIIVREGLVFDYPVSTRVIPDKNCKSLVGFVGAQHMTVEYLYDKDTVEGMFGIKLDKFTPHREDASEKKADEEGAGWAAPAADGADATDTQPHDDGPEKDDMVLVWKYYDKPSGLVYYLADGHDCWLRPPAAPDVFVSDFWPLYALTFNDVEHEDELYPPSDVRLMRDMQKEYNRSRQGKREHREYARPRTAYAKGTLDNEDIDALRSAKPFDCIGLNAGEGQDLNKVVQQLKVAAVDPNLYDTGEIMTDMQVVVGTSAGQLGVASSKSTATESAIASGSAAQTDSSSVDDLDAFLSCVARGGGQILLKEMSAEKVMRTVGPGAVWPTMTLSDIADELYLCIEAGSSGKPNQAIEVKNWQMMLPFLIQMPNISKMWLARETIRRLDDKADLTEAIAEDMPSVVAQNGLDSVPPQPPPGTPQPGQPGQPQPGQPGAPPQGQPMPGGPPGAPGAPPGIPAAQGPQGAHNAPPPPGGPSGSGPAFGTNQM